MAGWLEPERLYTCTVRTMSGKSWAVLERSLRVPTMLAQMRCSCMLPSLRKLRLNCIMELPSVLSLPLLLRFMAHDYFLQVLSPHLSVPHAGPSIRCTPAQIWLMPGCAMPLLRFSPFDHRRARDRRRCKAATPPQRPAQSKPRAKQLLSTQAHSRR